MKLVGSLAGLVGCLAPLVCGCSSAPGAPPVANMTQPPGTPRGEPTFPPGSTPPGATHTPYPIILAHGFSGFHNIGPLDYFFGVADPLRKDGHDVWIAQVDPYNDSYVRGAQLRAFVEDVLAKTGAPKVNLIGHSQGGLDCRYVASQMGARIGAVVTISGVHRGTPVADVAEGALAGPLEDAVAQLLQLFGATILDPNGHPNSNAKAAIHQLSSAGAAEFNGKILDDPRVDYYSVGGRANGSNGDYNCATPFTAPFVGRWDSAVQQTNPLLQITASIITNSVKPIPPTNDGLVSVASTKWGTFLGCLPADHILEVGQIGGTPPSAGNPFDYILFYRQLADWLVEKGY
jgi:triacylglycerol esterase/lipase EstA (alpha/beta hydrolase family)